MTALRSDAHYPALQHGGPESAPLSGPAEPRPGGLQSACEYSYTYPQESEFPEDTCSSVDIIVLAVDPPLIRCGVIAYIQYVHIRRAIWRWPGTHLRWWW